MENMAVDCLISRNEVVPGGVAACVHRRAVLKVSHPSAYLPSHFLSTRGVRELPGPTYTQQRKAKSSITGA